MNMRNTLAAMCMGAVLFLVPGCFPEFPSEGGGGNGGGRVYECPLTTNIRYGADAVVCENLHIGFIDVPEDSRCPLDATCLWAGNARVVLDVRVLSGGETARVELNTHPDFQMIYMPGTAEVAGYTIKLVGLQPEPVSTVPIDPRDYVATLEIVKK